MSASSASTVGLDRRSMPIRFLRAWYHRNHEALRRFVLHDLLHADDPPHRVALGMAVGMFVAFTPTVGIQMVIAGFLSWLLRANKAVSMAAVWISNPATLVPIYWYGYRIGCAVLALDPIGRAWWAELATPPTAWWPAVSFYWSRLLEVAVPLWLGGAIVGLVCGYASYSIVYQAVRLYRLRRLSRVSVAPRGE